MRIALPNRAQDFRNAAMMQTRSKLNKTYESSNDVFITLDGDRANRR
jgi:hypothetical protein